jgi:hypothetical protein
VISNSTSFACTSAWPKTMALDEELVALCCFLAAAFVASRRPDRGLEGAEHAGVRLASARAHARPTKRARRSV